MPVITLDTTNPFRNLAAEEQLLHAAALLGPTLMIWRNDPCVVIGRHQNPWVECDLRRMKRDGVPLVRRISGGGAVYHDHGNANFSFIAPDAMYDRDRHFRVVIAALASLGISAWKSERNDLRVGERKISGNAFRHTRGNSLHHGTLLVAANLELLTAYLAPRAALIETRATASVRSTVMNLTEARPGLDHETLAAALAGAFADEYGRDAAERLSADAAIDAAAPPPAGPAGTEIHARARELASWTWVYGHTPSFVRRFDDGEIDDALVGLALEVRRGVIVDVHAETGAAVRLRDTLVGLEYDSATVVEAARRLSDDAALAGLVQELAEAID